LRIIINLLCEYTRDQAARKTLQLHSTIVAEPRLSLRAREDPLDQNAKKGCLLAPIGAEPEKEQYGPERNDGAEEEREAKEESMRFGVSGLILPPEPPMVKVVLQWLYKTFTFKSTQNQTLL
jgi:hypothetical protein